MKCKDCGKTFDPINTRGLVFSAITKKGARGYHPCSRMVMKKQRDWTLYLSVHDEGDMGPKSNTPHPTCPACFLKKLKRAVVALENALEGKGINPDDTPEQEQQTEQPKKPEIVVPSAEEIKRDYPDWVKLVTKTNNGVPLEDEDLREIFRMQRKIGAV